MLPITGHLLRRAQHRVREVEDVATQLEHDPAGIGSQTPSRRGLNHLAHHGVDFKRLAEIPLGEELAEQHDGRTVAVHVTHLHEPDVFGQPGRECV